jgi:hypothetical protein
VVGPGDDGEVFWVRLYDESGVLVATADFSDVPAGASAWGSSTGESWVVNHGSLAAEPEVVGDEPDDWGLNLKGDPVLLYTSYVAEIGAVAVAISTTQHPAADTILLANQDLPNQFSIAHTAAGMLRVRVGENIYETPAVLGDIVVIASFGDGVAEVYANEVEMELLTADTPPGRVEILPATSGEGSADDADYRLTGFVILNHPATAVERSEIIDALTS